MSKPDVFTSLCADYILRQYWRFEKTES